MEALLEASTDCIVGLYTDAVFCQVHGNRKSLQKKDLDLARRIRGIRDSENELPLQEQVKPGRPYDKPEYVPGRSLPRWKPKKQIEREEREAAEAKRKAAATKKGKGSAGSSKSPPKK